MSQPLWTTVDRYLNDLLHEPDEALEAAVASSKAAGLPEIQVSESQGKLLHLLARSIQARRVLEVGTLGGYSTIWLGRALPAGGRLVSLEVNPAHAEVARKNLERAGLGDVVEVRLGPAIQSLPVIHEEGGEAFDFVFIDADKPSNADYFEWAVRLARPGAMIVVDNVVREGTVADPAETDPAVLGVRRLLDLIHGDRRVSATGVQTVGAKGYDGFILATVL